MTELAFIWAETAAHRGETQLQQQSSTMLYHSLPPSQLATRWARWGGGGYILEAQRLSHAAHNGFWNTLLVFSALLWELRSFFLCDTLYNALLWLNLKEYPYHWRAWLECSKPLYRSDIIIIADNVEALCTSSELPFERLHFTASYIEKHLRNCCWGKVSLSETYCFFFSSSFFLLCSCFSLTKKTKHRKGKN